MARSVQRSHQQGSGTEQLRGVKGLALGTKGESNDTRTSVFVGTTLRGVGVPQYFLIGSAQIS